MTRRLVFVHGRAQEHKEAQALKDEWVASWRRGLAKRGRDLPISESDIRFPYYGQTLYDIVNDASEDRIAEVIVKGSADDSQRAFTQAVLDEVKARLTISDDEISAIAGDGVVQKGLQNNRWVLALLRAIDSHVPGGSGATIAAVTNDVYQYVRNPGVRDRIEEGVRSAFTPNASSVVVAHSLGTVVAYALLNREGKAGRWDVPLFVTVGSPLAVTMIKRSLNPIKSPSVVKKWVNALDVRDVVALYPLDKAHFGVTPRIENLAHVQNGTPNRHGIAGYLEDEIVASRIYDALTAT